MGKELDFTKGKIVGPLLQFAVPVLLAMFLQSLYGAVDMMIVGKFAAPLDTSAVSTGSQIMFNITCAISGFAMGTTILLGQMIGEGNKQKGGEVIGVSLFMFSIVGVIISLGMPILGRPIASMMNAPAEAFERTVSYVQICGAGTIVIIAYNLIGSFFRGIGDSRTPLMTVAIAAVVNIFGDLLFVAVFNLGASGAAIATVFAQFVSVVISLAAIRKRELPFTFNLSCVKFKKNTAARIIELGAPIALQEILIGISFLVVLALVNSISVYASAGVGVAEKVCGFIMLVPSAFMQSMSAFTSQNIGARKYSRAKTALKYAILVSSVVSLLMFYLAFFHGNLLSYFFTSDSDVSFAAAEYLKAYAIDCLMVSFLFCFTGFFNGIGSTKFVMVQGLIGAFFVRIPVAFFMSKWNPVTMFHMGLSTPCSTAIQILICIAWFFYLEKKVKPIYDLNA